VPEKLNIVFIGLSITSSWGNGHATTYRGLLRELARRGHDVTFLERDVPWYAAHRDLPKPGYCALGLYESRGDLEREYKALIRSADAVIVGSYVPEGVDVGYWATRHAEGKTAFYDIDTPVTLAKLEKADFEYLSPDLIPRFNLYLSFTGGPTLERLENRFGAQRAQPLYCSFDPDLYYPEPAQVKWDLGYMGTYSADRQPPLQRLLIEPARTLPKNRFVVAGPQYPKDVDWPQNVERIEHLPPVGHRQFYNSQRYTLNITRADMIAAGYSPSVRLFEAAACGTPIISDWWQGLDEFFDVGSEIYVARSADEVRQLLSEVGEEERRQVGLRARERVLREHTATHRAQQLEQMILGATSSPQNDAVGVA
jgi:spore maturation protein CgeB